MQFLDSLTGFTIDLPLMKIALPQLSEMVLTPLRLIAPASAADSEIHRKIFRFWGYYH